MKCVFNDNKISKKIVRRHLFHLSYTAELPYCPGNSYYIFSLLDISFVMSNVFITVIWELLYDLLPVLNVYLYYMIALKIDD